MELFYQNKGNFLFSNFTTLKNSIELIMQKKIELDERSKFLQTGINFNINDNWSSKEECELVTVLKNGDIVKSLVYIPELKKRTGNPKYHLYNCEAIYSHPESDFKKTYSNDGKFLMLYKSDKFYKELELCGYCKNIYAKKNKKKEFNLKEFLEEKSVFFEDDFEDEYKTLTNTYSANWKGITKKLKEHKQYICEECNIQLKDKKLQKFCHTHHINMKKKDNKRVNLKVLCIECHSKQPKHEKICSTDDYKDFIELKEKGILI